VNDERIRVVCDPLSCATRSGSTARSLLWGRYRASTRRLTIHSVLPDLAPTREPVLLEQLDGRAEQESTLGFATGGRLGDRLDEAAAGSCDLRERALERSARDSPTPVPLVHEDAGDPPVRTRWRILEVFTVVLEPSGLPYWHQPCAAPSRSKTSAACARPALTSCSFSVRGSLTPRWYSA
jgi:hypothetical protein